MSRSMKLLEAFSDIDEQLLIEKEKTNVKNSHQSYLERVIGMRKLKYVLAPVCMLTIAVVGYVGYINTNHNSGIEENPIVDLSGVEQKENLKISLDINKISDMGMASLDADIREVSYVMIPYFGYMTNLVIPEDFDSKENHKAVYVRSDIKDENYGMLNNYEFTYRNTSNNRKIIIAFSDKYKPLRDYIIDEGANKISKIGDVELIISQYKNMYIVTFTHKGINFDIETVDITESELVALLESIINRVNYPVNIDDIEDKDIGAKEQPKEIIEPQNTEVQDKDTNTKQKPIEVNSSNYPDYYGGKYIDGNGNNVIWLCEDTETNRKAICSFFGITESKTIFKTARYSYNYLTELQEKISKAMSNKEIPFVTSSALRDTTNNIVVTVTSQNEKNIEKVKKLDTIGGAIEIKYSEHSAGVEDLGTLE